MRTPFFVGNWKMNLTSGLAEELARTLVRSCRDLQGLEVAVAPPAVFLSMVATELAGSPIGLAAQNCHWEGNGAFTGEVSAEMIREIGCTCIIVGHSERRQHFGETDETVNLKVLAALRAGLRPILCVGETLKQREVGETLRVVTDQLRGGLKSVTPAQISEVTVAYEPVWAIGTGKVANPQQAQEVHRALRAVLLESFGPVISDTVRIQYGGSVNPGNIKDLMAEEDIDGALVGGASLKADSFLAILSCVG